MTRSLTLIQRFDEYGNSFSTKGAGDWCTITKRISRDGIQTIQIYHRLGLTYYEVGDCGEIRIVNTHLQEVEELIEEPRDNEERLRKLKSLVRVG